MPRFVLFLRANGNDIKLADFEAEYSHGQTVLNAVNPHIASHGLQGYELDEAKVRIDEADIELSVEQNSYVIMTGEYHVFLRKCQISSDSVTTLSSTSTSITRDNSIECVTISRASELHCPPSRSESIRSIQESNNKTSNDVSALRGNTHRITVSARVRGTTLAPALLDCSLDSFASSCKNDDVKSAVEMIKAGQIPTHDNFRIALIAAMGTKLMRHCAKENHPTIGESGQFFLHLMKDHPHMLDVYEDWAANSTRNFLIKYAENARRTLQKRGMVKPKSSVKPKKRKTLPVTFDQTVLDMAEELRKMNDLNSATAKRLIGDTFEYRTTAVKTLSVEEVYEQFPSYFYSSGQLLITDFERIVFNVRIQFASQWEDVCTKLMEAVNKNTKRLTAFKKLAHYNIMETDIDKKSFDGLLAAMTLTGLSNKRAIDRVKKIFVDKTGETVIANALTPTLLRRNYPFIIKVAEDDDTYYLRVGNRNLLFRGRFSTVLEGYMAVFKVFNIGYPNLVSDILQVLASLTNIIRPEEGSPTLHEIRRSIF